MEKIFEVFKELENQGCTIECGVIEKSRRKEMSEAMKKFKESNDENKIRIAKRLARYYFIFDNMGPITTCPEFPFEEDKYGLHYVHVYLNNFVDSAKRSIAGVIKALADDEKLDPFCRYLMFTHLYTPEEVKEIGHEEIYEKEKKFEKDLGLIHERNDDFDSYEIAGCGKINRRGYFGVNNVNNEDESVNIPFPLDFTEKWFRDFKEVNNF